LTARNCLKNQFFLSSFSLENDSQLELSNKSIQDNVTGSFFSSSYGKIHQDFLKSETSINCVLSILGTNYTRRKETIYYGNENSIKLMEKPANFFFLETQSNNHNPTFW
jgi:hypothetical protein